MPKPSLSADYVRSILDYDPDTGVFLWRVRSDATVQWNGRFAGKVAGTAGKTYLFISVNNVIYRAHHLAWLIMNGSWLETELDHENLDKLDNRWTNLRIASHSQNMANMKLSAANKSGFKGVSWDKRNNNWTAQIGVGGKKKHLGCFSDPAVAHAAYIEAATCHFGEFARAS